MTCMASANREGILGSERVCLCTEGFGNRMCSLENVSNPVTHFDPKLKTQHFKCYMLFSNILFCFIRSVLFQSVLFIAGSSTGYIYVHVVYR